MRFRFDDCRNNDFQGDKYIIDIFNSILPKYIVIHSYKGSIFCYIVNKDIQNQYDYYNMNEFCSKKPYYYYTSCIYPYTCKICFTGDGTVDKEDDEDEVYIKKQTKNPRKAQVKKGNKIPTTPTILKLVNLDLTYKTPSRERKKPID